MTVNFVNPHDIMSFDYGSPSAVDLPLSRGQWDVDLPASAADDLHDAPRAVREYARLTDTVFGPVTSATTGAPGSTSR
jgi:arylsulfatase